MHVPDPAGKSLGSLLKDWRERRTASQLDVALEAGISARHLSYIENGKAHPSETLVYALLRVLDIPASERNVILLAAGLRPRVARERDDATNEASRSDLLRRYLDHAVNHPVIVKDAIWDVVAVNGLGRRLFKAIMGRDLTGDATPLNVLDLVFAPDLMRPHIINWTDVADALIRHVRHEVGFAADHVAFRDVVSHAADYPGFQERWGAVGIGEPAPQSTRYRFAYAGEELVFDAMLLSLGSPYDAVLRGIRLDSFLPLNAAAQRFVDDNREDRPER
ncbi:MAG: helix-turn-helix domain-containing protein [Pseudomonadota bacterium]